MTRFGEEDHRGKIMSVMALPLLDFPVSPLRAPVSGMIMLFGQLPCPRSLESPLPPVLLNLLQAFEEVFPQNPSWQCAGLPGSL